MLVDTLCRPQDYAPHGVSTDDGADKQTQCKVHDMAPSRLSQMLRRVCGRVKGRTVKKLDIWSLVAAFLAVDAYAAFPSVEAVTESAEAAATTSHGIDMATTVNADELLIIFFSCSAGNCFDSGTDPTGWTRIHHGNHNGIGEYTIWAKKAVGNEDGTTVTVTTAGSATSASAAYRISGWEADTVANGLECSSPTNALSTNPDPPSLTPTWGAKDTLWIANVAAADDDESFTGGPTDYIGLQSHVSGGGTDNGASIGSAYRELNATSDDPGTFTLSMSEAYSAITCAVEPSAASPPAFTSGPTESPATNGYTISGTVDADATVYAVATHPAESAPTCTQIQAGQNGSGAAAAIAANEAWTGAMADTFALTVAGAWPRHDIHVCASNVNGDSAVTSFSDQDRSADAGQAIVAFTSVASTGLGTMMLDTGCDTDGSTAVLTGCADLADFTLGEDAYISAGFATTGPFEVLEIDGMSLTVDTASNSMQTNVTVSWFFPLVATGDVCEYDTTSTNGHTVTIAADSDITIAGDGSYDSFDFNCMDTSTGGDYSFGPPSWGTGDETFHVNNSTPQCEVDLSEPLLWYLNMAISTLDLDTWFSDSDGHNLTYTLNASPTGTSLSGVDNKDLDSTPTAENETSPGDSLIVRADDITGEFALCSETVYVTDDAITMPTLTDGDQTAAINDSQAARPWLSDPVGGLTIGTACSAEASGDIFAQSPAASSTIDATEAISATASTGSECAQDRGPGGRGVSQRFGIGF